MLTDRSRRALYLSSSLAIATALVVGASAARAQSFQGTGTVVSGSATIGTATGTTTISGISSDAVINWTTFDTGVGGGPINFQPNGTTATFTSTADFSVLNRIIPTDPSRAVAFNGNVVSQIQGAGPPVNGGTVYFYSPGGVLVGSTAVFNVGNLGLTSIDPEVVGGVFEQGGGPEFVRFNGAVTPGSSVVVQPGAQINSNNAANSYVALVAPVIDQRGTITVNGAAALVSADAATITFNPNGLFDIQVTSGTSGNLGGTNPTLFNSGEITGPASSGAGDNHRIYAVAVPKNTAITLAIAQGAGNDLGFAIAGAADITGNAVVLSAGKDIVGGNIATASSAGGGTGLADLNISNSTITSSLRGASTDETFFFSIGGGTASAASSVDLQANGRATFTAEGAGSNTTANGAVTLNADRTGAGVTGGQTDIFAILGGTVQVNGNATLLSRGFGTPGTAGTTTGGAATGGIALIQGVSGGSVTITGNVQALATGGGGAGFTGGGDGGAGTGGRAQIFVRDAGSSVTVNGTATISGNGAGGIAGGSGTGGAGTGGQAFINAQLAGSGTLTVNGAASLTASGAGGNGFIGGTGTGGTATVAASVNNTVNLNQSVNIIAQGLGGNGAQSSGTGTGGFARLTLFQNGTVNVGTNAVLAAGGITGTGGVGTGTSVGGTASAVAQQNSVLDVNGLLQVAASATSTGTAGIGATGGTATVGATGNSRVDVAGVLRVRANGAAGDGAGTAGLGGTGTGGNAQLFVNTGGDVLANELNVDADGLGGFDPGNGAGSGTGGNAFIFAGDPGSTITIANGNSTGTLAQGDLDFLSAEGFGGVSNGGGNGRGGDATGGTATVTVNNGAVFNGPTTPGSQGSIRIIGRATAGGANTGAIAGGNATAGTINITVDNATYTSAALLPSAFASGGSATATATGTINGGNTVGGTRNINVLNGATFSTVSPGGTAGGQAGNGTASGRGGDASGGTATLTVDGASTFNLSGNFSVFTTNSPGSGSTSGNATGGTASARIAGGSTVNQTGPAATTTFNISADVLGNSPTVAGTGNGGTLTAGTATLVVENATLNAQRINVSALADATLGETLNQFYAQGSVATGGNATLQLIGATVSAANVDIAAGGRGGAIAAGQTGSGGLGTGGTARIIATGGTSTLTSSQSVDIESDGIGGNMEGTGPATGSAVGGISRLVANGGASLTINAVSVTASADGEGGEQGAGTAALGGSGTGGTAEVFANGGNLTINADLGFEADNDGGEGAQGGAGIDDAAGNPNALLHAQNGSITVNGITTLGAVGEGGDGSLGGRGGDATAGFVVIDTENSLAGPSAITLNGGLVIDASAAGGFGGDGVGSGPGGNGGDAFGGPNQIFGDAGNGTLVITGPIFANAQAIGGNGGFGGAGSGVGGDGGAGGQAIGGAIQIGVRSGLDTGAVNSGSATFGGAVQALADATGGVGGDGGSGGTGAGVGGAGGNAIGGSAGILVRGAPVTFTGSAVTLGANATGGDAGGGAVAPQVFGGSATVGDNGGVFITATSRFQQPTQRGTLNANGVFGLATATGGLDPIGRNGPANVGNQPVSVLFDSADGNVATIAFNAAGDIVTGTVPSQLVVLNGTLNLSDTLSLGTTGDLAVTLTNSTVNTSILSLSARNFVLAGVQPATFGTFNVSDGLSVSTGQDFLAYANFNLGFDAAFSIDGSFLVGDVVTDGDFEIDVTGTIATRSITANGTIDLVSGGSTVTSGLTATDSVFVDAGGALNTGAVSAGIVNPLTPPFDNYTIGLRSGVSITSLDLAARGNIGLSSPGTIAVGTATSGNLLLALAGTGFTSGRLVTTAPTGGRIYIANNSMESLGGAIGPNFNPTPILAAAPVAIAGPITISSAAAAAAGVPAVTTNGVIQAATLQALNVFGSTTARQAAVYVGGASINAGNITTGDNVTIASAGAINLGNVDVGLQIQSAGQRKIAIGSNAGPVTTGSLSAFGDLGVQTGGALTTGALRGRDVLLLTGGAVSTGAISAVPTTQQQTQQSGRIYIGNFSMATQAANVFQPFNTQGAFALFNTLPPVKIGGGITIGGAVTGRALTAAASQNFTAGTITLQPSQFFGNGLQVDSGGTIVVNGPWQADFMTLRSNDIDIPQGGSLAGFVELISTNTTMAAIGDFSSSAPNQPPSGAYRLTDAEFDRISGGFDFEARDNPAAVDILIGDLSVDATRFNSDSEGGEIAVEDDSDDELRVGRIRIDGNVTITGAPAYSPDGDSSFGVDFYSKSFELNAATGSLTIADAQGRLAGQIEIDAENIHVASDDILLKLRADPFYEGHVRELNAPARVQRPDGVLRAAGLELEGDKTIYIQNTGSSTVPAGFVTQIDAEDEEGTDIGPEDDLPSGETFKIVINGQVQTDTGVLTGAQAFQAVVDGARAEAMEEGEEFAASLDPLSTFNNCVILTGVCSTASDPVASLSSEITVVTNATLDDSPVAPAADDADEGDDGSSDDQEDESATDEGSSPIAPPTPLINTRALDGSVDVVEPVSGAGNPALFGSAVDETTAQGEPQ